MKDDATTVPTSETISATSALTTAQRAEASLGSSAEAIYRLVARTMQERHRGRGTLLDVGCGAGSLWRSVGEQFDAYIGADVICYAGFPEGAQFRSVDLDTARIDIPDGSVDVVACVETIEHVENPRALVRELARLARPGGLVIVTTPNQVSLLSKLGLLVKNQFPAFQERPGLYPAHITALLPVDLLRLAQECGLVGPEIRYSDSGRIPGTSWHWPRPLAGASYSDNVLMMACRPQ